MDLYDIYLFNFEKLNASDYTTEFIRKFVKTDHVIKSFSFWVLKIPFIKKNMEHSQIKRVKKCYQQKKFC